MLQLAKIGTLMFFLQFFIFWLNGGNQVVDLKCTDLFPQSHRTGTKKM